MRDIGGLLQGCAAAGRRVQPHIVETAHMYWAVHLTCTDCGALLTQQPVKCDVPFGGIGVVGRFNDRYLATQVHSRNSAAELSRQVGYCGLGYHEPSYHGHYRTLKNALLKGIPWERDLMLIKQLLDSTPQEVFKPSTNWENDEFILVVRMKHLKKVPVGAQAPLLSALINLLRDPESESPLPDDLVSDLRARGILDLPHDISGLKCEPDEQGVWYLEGKDLVYVLV